MQRALVLGMLLALLLVACGAPTATQPGPDEQAIPIVTVYKSPT